MSRPPPRSLAWLLPLLLAAQPIATDSYLPALPAIRADLGNAAVSLTVFVLAMGLGQLPSGPLSDRIGRRPVLLAGLGVYALAAFASAFTPNIAVLIGVRAVQGLAMGAILVCARAAVRDAYSVVDGAHALARGMTGLGAIALATPMIGALLVEYVGWRWVFVLMGVYASGLLVVCGRRFAETRVPAPPGTTVAGNLRIVFGNAAFRAWGGLAVATYAGIFAFLLLSPAVYITHFGLTPTEYAWIPTGGALVYIASTVLCRRLLRRIGLISTVRFGSSMTLLGALIQLAGCAWAPQSIWPLLLGHALYSLGHGIHQPCGQSGAVSDLPQIAGRAVAWSGFSMMLVAFAVGQTAARFMDDAASRGAWPMVLPIVAAAVVLAVISFFVLPRLEPAEGTPLASK